MGLASEERRTPATMCASTSSTRRKRCLANSASADERLGSPQEAVSYIVRVNIVSRDRIGRIVGKRDGGLARACASAGNVERGDGALLSTHETVVDVGRVHVLSRDRPWPADSLGRGALERACARARNIERGDSAIRG